MASYLKSLRPKNFAADAVSGFATGLFSIPEGMAYAQLAGVNPVYGLYSGMVPTIVGALSTGTILMISTLTSAIALSTASALEVAGVDVTSNPNALFTVTFLVGATMLIFGLARLGSLVSFVSNAVMTGFVMGASVLIIIGELGDFSGYDPSGANKAAEVFDLITNINQWDLTTTLVGIATILVVLLFKRIERTEKMASILALILMSVAVYVLNLSIELVGDIANIPSSLPTPEVPDFRLIPDLALGSISVALVALVQGAGISTAYPNPDKTKSSMNRDFIGQGLGNLVGSFFQAMGTGGSLSRSGISVGGGAKSRWGGILAGLWLAVLVLLFGDLAELVPMAVIAGLLFVIGAELILARLPDLRLVHRTSWGSAAALWFTFLSALFIPLQWTIFLGAGLSLLLYIYASSKSVQLRQLIRNDQGDIEECDPPEAYPSNALTMLNIGGQDFFAEVPIMEEHLPSLAYTKNAAVIFRLRDRKELHSTALKWLKRYAENLKEGNNLLILCDIHPHIIDELKITGLMDIIGEENVFPTQPAISASLVAAQAAAQNWLTSQSQDLTSVPSEMRTPAEEEE